MPPTERYERYAAIYDRTGQDDFSLWAWQTARVALDGLGWRGWHVLELACGTGAAAEQMAREGLQVVAVDLSRPMLLEARQRARHAEFRVVRADMRQLSLATGSFDLRRCTHGAAPSKQRSRSSTTA